MNTTQQQMTGAEIIAAVRAGTMTQDEVYAILMARIEADRKAPRAATLLEKAPPGGWTDSDKIAK